jgi:hypothetical protein
MVVPILTPNMTPMACTKESNPALMKPTVIAELYDDQISQNSLFAHKG